MARVPSHRHSTKHEHPGGGSRRRTYRLLALAAVALVGLLPATQAQAAPTVDEIESQIDDQWVQLEPTIEQYNKVHSQLLANQKKSADLQKKIQPLALQANMAMDRVGDLASRYYKTGPSSDLNALLTTGTPTQLADQLTILDHLARQQQEQIADVTAARDKYDAEKKQAGRADRPAEEAGHRARRQAQADRRRDQAAGEAAADRVRVEHLRRRPAQGPLPGDLPRRRRRHRGQDRLRADRQAVRLGRGRPELVRLLRADPVRLGQGRGAAHPPHR